MSSSLAALKALIQYTATVQNTLSAGNIAAAVDNVQANQQFASGTAAAQADREWTAERSLADATNEDINLRNVAGLDIGAGAGNDAVGVAMLNVDSPVLLVVNKASSTGNLIVGGEGSANAWTSFLKPNTATLTLPPDTAMMVACRVKPAFSVGAADNQLLRVAAAGGAVDYLLGFYGRSA